MVTIREHRIPTTDSKPYIAVQGPDGKLWFCESGASKIGRLDPDTGAFTEFALPTRNSTPIGITAGADGNLWFAEKTANKIGRLTPRGEITEFALPTANAGPDGLRFFIFCFSRPPLFHFHPPELFRLTLSEL